MSRTKLIASLVLLVAVVGGFRLWNQLRYPIFSIAQSNVCANGQIDLLEYLGPNDGNDYSLVSCSSTTEAGQEFLSVERNDSISTLDGDKTGFILHKNQNQETYFYDSNFIYFYEDTSWDKTCTDGSPAYYRVKDANSDTWGGRIPRCITLGQDYTQSSQIVAFNRETDQQCESQYAGATSNSFQVRAAGTDPYGPSNIPGNPQTIVIETTSGAGAGERKYYSQGYGLTGLYVNQSGGDVFHSTFDSGEGQRTELQCQEDSVSGSGVYERFVYPFYSDNEQIMLNQLVDDYEVSCVPKTVYNASVSGNVGELIQFAGCSWAGGNACFFDPSGSLTVTTLGSRLFGVLRNENNAQQRVTTDTGSSQRSFTNRFESVEQWYGANNPYDEIYSGAAPAGISPLHQGPYYKLASSQMQCEAAGEILKASVQLCNEWKERNPDGEDEDCPLAEYPVRGISDPTMSTLGSLAEAIPDTRNFLGKFGDFCSAYYNTDPEDRTTQQKRLREALSRVDLYMETAYRPAFLVAITEVDEQPFQGSQLVRAVRSDGGQIQSSTKHLVDYLIYHVPATLTDTDNGNEFRKDETFQDPNFSSDLFHSGAYSDVIKQTALILTPEEEIDDFEHTRDSYRDDVQEAVRQEVEGDLGAFNDPRIQCYEPECNEPLRHALITYINAIARESLNFKYHDQEFNLSCEDDDETYDDALLESGTQIGSDLQQKDSFSDIVDSKQYFNSQGGNSSVDELHVDFQMQQLFGAQNNLISPKPPQNEPKTIIYNVSPHRANAEFIASRLDALFTEAEQEDQFNRDTGYYDKFEAIFGSSFVSSDVTREYTKTLYPPEVATPTAEQKEVTASINPDGPQPLSARFEWLAKIFNRSTRAVTQLIFPEGSAALECSRANNDPAHNTEEYLRNCQNKGLGVPAGTTPIAGAQCVLTGGYNIESESVKNLLVSSAREYNIPVEVMMAVLWTENCRSGKSICIKTEAELSQYLRPGIDYPDTEGCPGSWRPSGTGVFQFDLNYWSSYADPNRNWQGSACNIPDSFIDAARWLSSNYYTNGAVSAIGTARPAKDWSRDDMKRVVSRWAGNVDTCSGHPYARVYCCLIDQLTTGENSCSEPWIDRVTAMQTTCNQ